MVNGIGFQPMGWIEHRLEADATPGRLRDMAIEVNRRYRLRG